MRLRLRLRLVCLSFYPGKHIYYIDIDAHISERKSFHHPVYAHTAHSVYVIYIHLSKAEREKSLSWKQTHFISMMSLSKSCKSCCVLGGRELESCTRISTYSHFKGCCIETFLSLATPFVWFLDTMLTLKWKYLPYFIEKASWSFGSWEISILETIDMLWLGYC